jgi:hypothetical protein
MDVDAIRKRVEQTRGAIEYGKLPEGWHPGSWQFGALLWALDTIEALLVERER